MMTRSPTSLRSLSSQKAPGNRRYPDNPRYRREALFRSSLRPPVRTVSPKGYPRKRLLLCPVRKTLSPEPVTGLRCL